MDTPKAFSKEDYDAIAKYVGEEFQKFESFHEKRFRLMHKIYDRWQNKPENTSSEDWHNNVNVPIIIEGEQTVTPRIFTALFPNDAPIDVQAEGDTPMEQANKSKFLIQHFFRVCSVREKSYQPITQVSLFGTGYAEAGSWHIKRGWVVDENQQRQYKLIESRPDFSPVDFFEMYPHPAKLEVGDPLPLIRRQYIDKHSLMALAGSSSFVNIQEAIELEPQKDSDKDYMPEQGESYELLTRWGMWDRKILKKEKDGTEKEVIEKCVPFMIQVINRKVCIRAIPNPYNHQIPPYVKIKLFEDARPSWFGVGIGQIGLPTQERINKLVNQRLDNVDLVLNRQGVYIGTDPLINHKKLQISEPGKWHKVSDVNNIKWLDTPDVTVSSYKEEEMAKRDFRESTGASAQLMPTEMGQHRTAMGIQILSGAAGLRFQPVLVKIEKDLIQETAMFFFSNLKQFMTEDEWVVITGENGESEPIKITPEQITAKVFFIPRGISETQNKEINLQQLVRFKEISKDDPTVNRTEINRQIGELMGFKKFNKILVNQQPVMSPSTLSVDEQQNIVRRLAEGATPQQIQAEMIGPMPSALPQQISDINDMEIDEEGEEEESE